MAAQATSEGGNLVQKIITIEVSMKNTSPLSKRTITVALTNLVFFAAGVAVPSRAQTPTVLYNFLNGKSDAAFPMGNIVQGRDGFMYGVGAGLARGANGTGAVYKISPAGVEKVFFNFPANFPNCISGLTLGTDGNFYGTCENPDGATPGFIYRLTPAGVFTDIHDFASGGAIFPPIQASDGNFYGVIPAGVYKMTLAGVFTMIHTFASPDVQPVSNVTQASDGNLYGTLTLCSNGNRGCVYKVSTAGVFAEVKLFDDTTGSFPCNGVIQGTDGKLYGTTGFGGANNSGDLYSVTTAGVEENLHDINSTTDGGCNSGSFPVVNMLQVNDGNFYGANSGGAIANNGSIFKLTSAHVFSAFLFPGSNVDGGQPYSTLIQNTNGKIYGSTSGGGTNSTGTFFSVSTGDPAFVLLQETSGKVESKIGILGQGFGPSSVIKFNGVTVNAFARTGATFLLATVPVGATDGFVTVTTGTTTLTSSKKFVVHNSWSSGAAIPTAVFGSASGTIGTKIYVVSGDTTQGGAPVSSNQVYNPTSNSWTTAAAIPTPVFAPASAVVGGLLYVVGGYEGSGQTPTNLVQIYTPATNKWTTGAAMPTARGSIAAAVESNAIYVIGGNGSTNRLNNVEKYVPSTNTWTEEAPLLVGKSEPSAGLLGTTIVAADGFTTSADTGDNEGYKVTTNKWSAQTADPTPRNASCYGSLLGQLYVAGGINTSTQSVTLNESFSVSTNKWTTQLPMPTAALWQASTVASGQLYCIGGQNNFQGTAIKNVQVYQP